MLIQPIEHLVMAVLVELFTDLFSAFLCVMSYSSQFPFFVPCTHFKVKHIVCFSTRNIQKVEGKKQLLPWWHSAIKEKFAHFLHLNTFSIFLKINSHSVP